MDLFVGDSRFTDIIVVGQLVELLPKQNKMILFSKKLRWSGGETDHPTRPHTILKNTKTEDRSPFFAFLFLGDKPCVGPYAKKY